ncbi:hypothetical protein CPB83DRAFT_855353 [Crepidotus variabilis]|uniref:Uncharacterized protein n=1 Tax=Crepidotus variabilis TaxID=179855 RepID=A0A9P6EF33_9AGAR|nr:hypothetical protein CPB83DRAFT_855353 [Crepidotus variabilis]
MDNSNKEKSPPPGDFGDPNATTWSTGSVAHDPLALFRLVTRMRFDNMMGEKPLYPTVKKMEDVAKWSSHLGKEFKDRGIPKTSWPDTAFVFFADQGSIPELNMMIHQKRDQRNRTLASKGVGTTWDWDDFLEILKEVLIAHDPMALRRLVTWMRFDKTTGEIILYPTINTEDDIDKWSSRLGKEFKDRGIPKTSWPDAALQFLADQGSGSNLELNRVMRRMRAQRNEALASEGAETAWDWDDFLGILKEALVELNPPSAFAQFQEEYPTVTKIAKTGLVVAGATAFTPVVVIGGLNALGFTATGVALGSIAAGLQSAIYGGATTGIFSLCQSVAATGAVPTAISAVTSLVAGASVWGGGDPSPGPTDADEGSDDTGSQQDGHNPTPTAAS